MARELENLFERGEDARPTAGESGALDAALLSERGENVRGWVKELPDDEPSLVWRSALNERLRAEVPHRRRPWILYPTWGVAAAGLLVLLVWTSRPQPVQNVPAGPSLEAVMVSVHRESVRSSEIAGAGMVPNDLATQHRPAPALAPFDWNETDLETL